MADHLASPWSIPGRGLVPMAPVDVARGWVTGFLPPGNSALPSEPPGESTGPMEALERCLREALLRPPCVVAFSGGRDSSVLLAVAVRVARREGLPLPVPVTRRHPGVESANEDDWQELVIRHLGVSEWVRHEVGDEVDLLGPMATASLQRHGVLWPVTTHVAEHLLRVACGGVVVTGEGGDEVFGPRRVTAVPAALRRPGRSAVVAVAQAMAPRVVRRRWLAARLQRGLVAPWLRAEARRDFVADIARDDAGEPLHWAGSIARHRRARFLVEGMHTKALLAAERDVVYVCPFADPGFLAAAGRMGGATGLGTRTQALRRLFADVLPDAMLARETKASFNAALFGRHSRAFVTAWDGSGVDTDLVDADGLAQVWAGDHPHAMSLPLLQSAFLAGQRPAAP